ncbi:enterobactin synthase subunit F [Glutamicibacter uratoxydans]|uniref:Enterobactin synthase subunit F n=1 Tax=Glutamicibacter uratoxydans TaxID=43667 RepID=A0A4Y4DQX6_GLUUR|nr:AMP-binding protein [Glutamicibacter uratoxydans]GED04901.1 enterobactin synthase subunit F [Glutamicibacter uratoxydans]
MTLAPDTVKTYPLTDAQRGIVHAELAAPDTADFSVGDAVVFRGRISAAALAEAVRSTLDEVPWLACRFDVQQMALVPDCMPRRPAAPGLLPSGVLRGELTGDSDKVLADALRATHLPRITLDSQLLREQLLLTCAEDDVQPVAVWVLAAHHILIDGYSISLLARRVSEHYTALVQGTEPAPAPFTQPEAVRRGEEQYHASNALARDASYWHERLQPAQGEEYRPTRLAGLLGAAGQRPDAAAVQRLRISGRPLDLGRFAAPNAVQGPGTWADAAIAAHALLAARLTGSTRAVLGLPAMNRTGAAALCPAPTINVLPLVVDIDPSGSIDTLLEEVSAARAKLTVHGRYRAEQLMRDLSLVGSDTALTASEINIKAFDAPLEVPGGTVALHALSEGPVDDICLNLLPDYQAQKVTAVLTAPAGTLAVADAAVLLEAYGLLFEQLAAAPGTTPHTALMLSPQVQRGPLAGAPAAEAVPPVLEELFAASVAATPEAPAITCEGITLSYRQLSLRADAVAAGLLRAGIGPGGYVLIALERGIDYVASILGIAAAGATSVPLDPNAPRQRNQRIAARLAQLEENPPLVLSGQAEHWTGFSVLDPAQLPPAGLELQLPAVPRSTPGYLLHTSGSTGEPKAVVVSREAFSHWAGYHRHAGFFNAGVQRIAQSLPLHFDGAWCTLLGVALGHHLHLISHESARDPQQLAAQVREHSMTWMDMTPSLAAPLLDTGVFDPGTPVRRLSVGGEGCSQVLWEKLRGLGHLVVENLYGPTEFTVDALVANVADSPDVVVGRPLNGLKAMVLDASLRPLPAGLPGELYLAGPQEAHGYLGQGALTAARFVADPSATGTRMYRTGDRAVIGHDGLLRFLGREDSQVKIRGYRIDVGEVESALATLPGVAHAVVRARGARLLAWAVAGQEFDAAGWREALGQILPPQMIPHALGIIEQLPLGSTGKLDEKQLPDPAAGAAAPAAPLTGSLQQAVAAAMAEALGMQPEQLGPDSDFFAQGGDSITAIALVSGLREAGYSSSVGEVFALRTIASIAAAATVLSAGPENPAAQRPELVALEDGARDRLAAMLARRRPRR